MCSTSGTDIASIPVGYMVLLGGLSICRQRRLGRSGTDRGPQGSAKSRSLSAHGGGGGGHGLAWVSRAGLPCGPSMGLSRAHGDVICASTALVNVTQSWGVPRQAKSRQARGDAFRTCRISKSPLPAALRHGVVSSPETQKSRRHHLNNITRTMICRWGQIAHAEPSPCSWSWVAAAPFFVCMTLELDGS